MSQQIKPLGSKPRPVTPEIDLPPASAPPLAGTIRNPLIVKFPTKQTLTFSDGLNFGLGLLVASLLFVVCILPIGVGALVIVLQMLGFAIGQAIR